MKNEIRLILETQLCSLIRKNYPDQDGINLRLDAAVEEIAALKTSKPKKKKQEKPKRPTGDTITEGSTAPTREEPGYSFESRINEPMNIADDEDES